MISHLILLLFIIAASIHLYYSWKDEEKGRAVTKPFLLILLVLYYVLSANPIFWLLFTALITSWLGDVLLIPKGNGWFFAGGIFFMVSHICFILIYVRKINWNDVVWPIIIILALIYLGAACIIVKQIWDYVPNLLIFPMLFYMIANSIMNLFAMMQFMTLKNPGAMVAYLGAMLFFISDCSLYLVRYHHNPDVIFKRHFTVMLTYLLGEFLITQGILML